MIAKNELSTEKNDASLAAISACASPATGSEDDTISILQLAVSLLTLHISQKESLQFVVDSTLALDT